MTLHHLNSQPTIISRDTTFLWYGCRWDGWMDEWLHACMDPLDPPLCM